MTSPTQQRRRRRRLLALATAGLALCIGVSVTSLAAWQQQINVTPGSNSIGSSLLRIEISFDDVNWTTATVNSNGNLGFSGSPTLLTPSDTVYAGVWLRAAANSRGANVSLAGASGLSDTLITTLTYAARAGSLNGSCSATSFASLSQTLVGAGSALTAGSGGTTFSLPAGTSGAPGAEVGICLAVSLPSTATTAVSGLATSPLWQFNATSN